MEVQTDKTIQAKKPDVIVINKKENNCKITDFTVPAYHRVNIKEKEKRNEYTELDRELKGLWNIKNIKIASIILGVLETIPKILKKNRRNWNQGKGR